MATQEIGIEQEDGRWNESTGAHTTEGTIVYTIAWLRSLIFRSMVEFPFHIFVLMC